MECRWTGTAKRGPIGLCLPARGASIGRPKRIAAAAVCAAMGVIALPVEKSSRPVD